MNQHIQAEFYPQPGPVRTRKRRIRRRKRITFMDLLASIVVTAMIIGALLIYALGCMELGRIIVSMGL